MSIHPRPVPGEGEAAPAHEDGLRLRPAQAQAGVVLEEALRQPRRVGRRDTHHLAAGGEGEIGRVVRVTPHGRARQDGLERLLEPLVGPDIDRREKGPVPAAVADEEREHVPFVDRLGVGQVGGEEVELEVADGQHVAWAHAMHGEPHLAEECVSRARRVRGEEHRDVAIDLRQRRHVEVILVLVGDEQRVDGGKRVEREHARRMDDPERPQVPQRRREERVDHEARRSRREDPPLVPQEGDVEGARVVRGLRARRVVHPASGNGSLGRDTARVETSRGVAVERFGGASKISTHPARARRPWSAFVAPSTQMGELAHLSRTPRRLVARGPEVPVVRAEPQNLETMA